MESYSHQGYALWYLFLEFCVQHFDENIEEKFKFS